MAAFELCYLADEDIEGIISYTIDKWDVDQAGRYVRFLDQHFEAIGSGKARCKCLIPSRDDLFVKCQKHLVFHFEEKGERPLILAIFHEQMDLMKHLSERLEDLGI